MDVKNNRKLALLKLRMKIRERSVRKKHKAKSVKTTQPRYDETFFRGLSYLNEG